MEHVLVKYERINLLNFIYIYIYINVYRHIYIYLHPAYYDITYSHVLL